MCNIKLNNEKNIKKIEKDLKKYIENQITTNINNIRKTYNSDIFGFLDLIYKKDYNTYKEIKNNWYDKTYQNIKINVKTSINIIGNCVDNYKALFINTLNTSFETINTYSSDLSAGVLVDMLKNYITLGTEKNYTQNYLTLDAIYVRPSQAERAKNNEL